MPALRHNHALQRQHDVQVALLDAGELQARFPWLRTDDLAGGSLGLAEYALLAQGHEIEARPFVYLKLLCPPGGLAVTGLFSFWDQRPAAD